MAALTIAPLEPTAVAPVVPGPAGPAAVAHVADYYRRYIGEPLTLFTRVEAQAPLAGFTLRLRLPDELVLPEAAATASDGAAADLVFVGETRYLIWQVERDVAAGERFEYEVRAHVGHIPEDRVIDSEASVQAQLGGGQTVWASETVSVTVETKGRYLKYLPAIYSEYDELMGRFLMLFESFWAPIEAQIGQAALYFDPLFTPAELLPWLATWVDLTLDERWPEEKRRQLLRSAVSLYRRRGTKRGLQEYLEIYTGAQVQIREHGAHNFRLGAEARLGPGVALGTVNRPHTFTVTVFLPADNGAGQSPAERARFEAERRRMIEAIIEAEKPAHTSYTLRVETV